MSPPEDDASSLPKADGGGRAGADPSLPALSPDAAEAEELDNIVPTRGYNMTHVVGLGGSAGSLAPLRSFFASVPSDAGVAFVVVVHLAAQHESALASVLQRCTDMRVAEAQDGEPIFPNAVYVIPPGKQLSLTDDRIRLVENEREPGRRVEVDLFFRSLADTHGPHATAIVLSGADSDGAIGIKRIKERGGLTIAQDPRQAEYDGMPRAAIETGMVDWGLEAEEMSGRVVDYARRESRLQVPPEQGPNPASYARSPNQEEAALREVLSFLRMRTGRDFSYYKRATIVRRVARRMQVNDVYNLEDYLAFLRLHPGESGALLQDLLISVTNFFRDREAFAALSRHVPALFGQKHQGDTARVWVPACATGEEAYSIAMLLIEHARTLDAPPSLQVFATDLDDEVIQKAATDFIQRPSRPTFRPKDCASSSSRSRTAIGCGARCESSCCSRFTTCSRTRRSAGSIWFRAATCSST